MLRAEHRDDNGRASGDLDSLGVFLAQAASHRLLTPTEEVALAKRIERGDAAARRLMIESNLRLVVTLASDFRGGDRADRATDRGDAGRRPRSRVAESSAPRARGR